MTNEMSLEGLYMSGIGMNNHKNESYRVGSMEAYDGSSDTVAMEFARSEEALNFLDTFSMIEQKNARDKINMLRRIASCYGNPNNMDAVAANSIESYCVAQSMEAGEAAAATATDTAPETTPKPETTKKKVGFWKTIIGALKRFFSAIWNMLKTAVTKIGEFFAKFKKKQAESGATEDTQKIATPSTDTSNEKTLNSAGVLMLNWSKGLNSTGLVKFVNEYTAYSKLVENFDKKLATISATTKAEKDNRWKNANLGADDIIAKAGDLLTIGGFNSGDSSLGQSIKSVASSSGKDFKKNMEKAASAFNIATDGKSREKVYSVCEKLLGLTKADENQLKKASQFDINRGAASATLEKLVAIEKGVLSKLDAPHKLILSILDKLEKDLNVNEKAEKLTTNQQWTANLVVTLKFATKVESAVVKVFNIANQSCIKFSTMKHQQPKAK